MNKKHCEIILSGIGGQGIITSGILLGKAASLYENRFATMTKTYGVSARGGYCRSDVIIDSEFVSYFKVLNSDIILILNNKAYSKIETEINKDTLIIINSDEVDDYDLDKGIKHFFPMTKIAYDIGSLLTINIIALGIIAKKTGIIGKKSIKKVVKNKYPSKKATEMNMQAIDRGFKL